MFVVFIYFIAITVCYITKFEVFLYLSILVFLPFLSAFVFYNNFHSFCELMFPEKSFTDYLYITTFVDVVYSTYFLHTLLL